MKRDDKKKKATGRMTATEKNKDQLAGSPNDQETSMTSHQGMSPALQAHIGRQVRAMFDEVADEPIPDHLLQLLKDLDRDGEK